MNLRQKKKMEKKLKDQPVTIKQESTLQVPLSPIPIDSLPISDNKVDQDWLDLSLEIEAWENGNYLNSVYEKKHQGEEV